jgi:LysM repeat protein
MRRRRAAGLAAACLLIASSAVAQDRATQIHKVRPGDTLQLLAAEYYGDRHHAVFIMVANEMSHPRELKRGERLRIPVSRDITANIGDTLESLAATHLGDKRRAPFLAEFNGIEDDASIAAGQPLVIPFHVTHRAAARETVGSIAAAYFGESSKATLLSRYNFLDKDVLEPGESITIPIYHVRVRAGKLPPPDAESQARVRKRHDMQELTASALPDARAAWRSGDYATVKRVLTPIDTDFLDAEAAVEVGVILGSCYIAFGDVDSALATFRRVIERKPQHALSAYDVSPKIREVWKRAGGVVTGGR